MSDPSNEADLARRFAALESHADVPSLMQHEARASDAPMELPVLALSLLGIAIVGFALSLTSSLIVGPLAIVPFLLVVIAVIGIASSILKARAIQRSPLQRVPALILEERTKITSKSGGASETQSFAMLQLADGSQHEVCTHGSLSGKIASGDIGIAFVRAGLLVDFGRVQV